jgi:hypothetical protein
MGATATGAALGVRVERVMGPQESGQRSGIPLDSNHENPPVLPLTRSCCVALHQSVSAAAAATRRRWRIVEVPVVPEVLHRRRSQRRPRRAAAATQC